MSELNIFRQPRAFYMIFFIEMWERFGFAGLQALLALYFVKSLGMSNEESFSIFGAFYALCWGFVAIGGYIGDNILGTKRTILLGAITLAIGYTLMALAGSHHAMVYIALGTLSVGIALFKGNPPSLLAKCYKEGDERLDGAFTMYYMSINLGGFISMISVPTLASHLGWGIGFLASTVGLIFSIIIYIFQHKAVKNIGSPADMQPLQINKLIIVIAGSVVASLACAWLLKNIHITEGLLIVAGTLLCAYFIKEICIAAKNERKKMITAFILIIEATVFFALYLQIPTSINFFAIDNVEHSILGFSIDPLSFQSLNTFWIAALSPLLAIAYTFLSKKNKDLSIPAKFTTGMVLCSISFFVLSLSGQFATNGIVSSNWLILSYALQSAGELLISALGLAMVAQLIPQRLHGFLMGFFYLSIAAGSYLGGVIATFASIPDSARQAPATETLASYTSVFNNIGLTTLVIAALMALLTPFLAKMINDKTYDTPDHNSNDIYHKQYS